MSKEIDEFYEQYSARIMALDDEPLFATGTFGTFKMLSVEEYEKIQKQISVLEKQRNNYRHKRNEYRNKVRVLQKQLATMKKAMENAIVPRFKIGQEVYYYHIARNKTYSGCIEDIQWFATRNGIYYRISQLQRDYFWIREDELFATKEEAEAKLKEIKNG